MRTVLIGLAVLALASGAMAQDSAPAGEKLNARRAASTFEQLTNNSFMGGALLALSDQRPAAYAKIRQDFLRTAQDEGVRAAMRGVSGAISQSVVTLRPRLAGAPEDLLNDLLAQHVDTLRVLRDENPAACVAFTETLTPPASGAPSEAASRMIFDTMALAIIAAAATDGEGERRSMTADDRKLLAVDAENARIANQGGVAGRCQSYVTLFGTVLAQPPARSARMFGVLLGESFASSR